MGIDFSADLAALRTAASGITGVLDDLGRGLDDVDCRPAAFGHDRLASTVGELCDRWRLGVAHLAEDGAELADGLSQTAVTYQQADATAAQVLLDAAAALGGPTVSGQEAL